MRKLVVENETNANGQIHHILLDGKKHHGYFINHGDLVSGKQFKIILK